MRSDNISGFAAPGFEAVKEAFVENFRKRKELGAACCVYHHGEKVVDLWGGIRDKSTGFPWERDTMVLVFSATKGIAGLAMAHAQAHGLFDYDELVATYWPEFAQRGKGRITVRQLMSHQAGLFALDTRPDAELVSDLDRLGAVLARQKPAWEPGTRQAYHAITLGFYEGELLRRVDPQHRTIGQYFQEEIAHPLELDFYIRLPEEIPNFRLASLERPSPANAIAAFIEVPYFGMVAMNPRSRVRRALWGSEFPEREAKDRIYARNLEIPAGGGVGTARAMAKVYSEFATEGTELGIGEETLSQLTAQPEPPALGFRDGCLKAEIRFSLGFAKPGPQETSPGPSAFGHPGAGGSYGFADPASRIGYAYVMNQMSAHLIDPRDAALREAVYTSIGEMGPSMRAGESPARRRRWTTPLAHRQPAELERNRRG